MDALDLVLDYGAICLPSFAPTSHIFTETPVAKTAAKKTQVLDLEI